MSKKKIIDDILDLKLSDKDIIHEMSHRIKFLDGKVAAYEWILKECNTNININEGDL